MPTNKQLYIKIGLVICGILLFVTLLAYKQVQSPHVVLAAPVIQGFEIPKPGIAPIQTQQSPMGLLNQTLLIQQGKQGINTDVRLLPNLDDGLPRPKIPGGLMPETGPSRNISVVGIFSGSTNPSATIKIDNDYVNVKPGAKVKGYTIENIDDNGVYLKIGNQSKYLKYGD